MTMGDFNHTHHINIDTPTYFVSKTVLSSMPPAERRKEEEKERLKNRKRALVARLKEIARG